MSKPNRASTPLMWVAGGASTREVPDLGRNSRPGRVERATPNSTRFAPVSGYRGNAGGRWMPRTGKPTTFPYFMILATTPAPTVRPPSRIAKRRPSSIAIGTRSSTTIDTLSPGITISVPSGSFTEPVTSVVRK